MSSSQQLDTTAVLAYVCSLFIRRKLISLKQKRKEYTSLLPSPLLSLVVDADAVERGGGGEPTSHGMWHAIIIVVVVYLL